MNILEKAVAQLKSRFINKEKQKGNSDEVKRKMCERSVLSGVCPHCCDKCAWNTLGGGTE